MRHINSFWSEIKDRWRSTTPLFFKNVIRISLTISGTAMGIHEAIGLGGGMEPAWWVDIYPYMIGIPAGMATLAKLTKEAKEDNNDGK